MKTDVPSTSKEAYKLAKLGLVDAHKKIILSAFERLGDATADEIAAFTGMEHAQVNRRFVELARDEEIINTFKKRPTRKRRAAYVWTRNKAGAKTETKTPYSDGQKTAAEFAGELIKSCKQPTLF